MQLESMIFGMLGSEFDNSQRLLLFLSSVQFILGNCRVDESYNSYPKDLIFGFLKINLSVCNHIELAWKAAISFSSI